MMLSCNTILDYLKEHKKEYTEIGIDIIGVFGSYAKSTNTKDSDIDILYDTKKGIEGLHDKKLEATFNTKVDLASKKYLKPYVKNEIMKDLKYL